jgi:predicted ester cyclase
MSAKENKDLVTRYFKESNAAKGDITKVATISDKYYAPEFVYHLTTGDMNFEEYKQFAVALVKIFPDANFTIDDIIAVGDKVIIRRTLQATHKGEFLGVAPTGKKISQAGISIFRIAGGKITEIWTVSDIFGLMQQLGAIPNPFIPAK